MTFATGAVRAASDLDNVLIDIVESARMALASDHGLPEGEVLLTGVYSAPFTHADPDTAARLVVSHGFWDREDVVMGCLPLPGAVEAMRRLADAGILIGYVTRRPPAVEEMTLRWMRQAGFPMLPIEHVGTTDAQTTFDRCKSVACRRMGATHLIDDHATEIRTARAAGIEVVVVDAAIGRAARHQTLRDVEGAILVPDARGAADHLMSYRRAAA